MRERLQRWAADILGPDAGWTASNACRATRASRWAFDVGRPSGWCCACRRWGRGAARPPTCTGRLRCSPRSPSTACPRRGCGGAASTGRGSAPRTSSWTGWRAPHPATSSPKGGAPAPSRAVFAEAMRVLAGIHATPPPSDWRPATPLRGRRRPLAEAAGGDARAVVDPGGRHAARSAARGGARGRPARPGARRLLRQQLDGQPTASSSPSSTGRARTAATAGSTSAGSR